MIEIILPFYNGSKYINEQINSIGRAIAKSNQNITLVIINDCSMNQETIYIESLLKNISIPFRYLRNKENIGVIKSIEQALTQSKAQYFFLADQDDYWYENKIDIMLQEIADLPKDKPWLIFTDLEIVDEKLNSLNPSMVRFHKYNVTNIGNEILFQNIVTGCTVFFNRLLVNVALPFPENITMHDHWLALCAKYSGKLHYIDQSLVKYRQHSNNQIGAYGISFKKRIIINHKKTAQVMFLSERISHNELSDIAQMIQVINIKNFFGLYSRGLKGMIFLKFILAREIYKYMSKSKL